MGWIILWLDLVEYHKTIAVTIAPFWTWVHQIKMWNLLPSYFFHFLHFMQSDAFLSVRISRICTVLGFWLSTIAQASYFELHHLVSIGRFVTSTTTATLVSAYCFVRNWRLYLTAIFVLLMIWHLACNGYWTYGAGVILYLPRSAKMATHLKSLHWLPVKVRSTYKIACLCYHCHMLLICHRKSHRTPATLSPAHHSIPLLNRPANSNLSMASAFVTYVKTVGDVNNGILLVRNIFSNKSSLSW